MTSQRGKGSMEKANIETDVVIIGGGIAGLTSAIGLRDSGLRITIIEESDILGGRARSWIDQTTGDTIDIAPHILVRSFDPNLTRLMDILGTTDQVVWNGETFITLVEGQERYDLKMSKLPAPFHALPWITADKRVSPKDLLSNVPVTLFALQMNDRDVKKLDQINMSAFLLKMGVTPFYIKRFWSFICMAIMNVPIELCSAGALMRFYQGLMGTNKYRSGFAREGLGNLFVPRSVELIEAAGGEILTETTVAAIECDGRGFETLWLRDGRQVRARYCISTVPPQNLMRILPTVWKRNYTPFKELVHFRPSPYVGSYIWFDRKLTDLRFWARTFEPESLNLDFYDLSNINPKWRGKPSLIASNIIYSRRAEELSDEEIVAITVEEIAEFLPEAAEARVAHWVLNHIPLGIPCPHPGMEARRPATRTDFKGFLLAGDWVDTGLPWSMESATRSGWLAAEEVLKEIGQPRSLALKLDEPRGLPGLLKQGGQLRPSGLLARWKPESGASARPPAG